MTTAQQVQAATDLVVTLGQAILAAGPQGIPSGHLYAMICDKVSLDVYQRAIALLKRSGIVKESGHVLTIQIKGN